MTDAIAAITLIPAIVALVLVRRWVRAREMRWFADLDPDQQRDVIIFSALNRRGYRGYREVARIASLVDEAFRARNPPTDGPSHDEQEQDGTRPQIQALNLPTPTDRPGHEQQQPSGTGGRIRAIITSHPGISSDGLVRQFQEKTEQTPDHRMIVEAAHRCGRSEGFSQLGDGTWWTVADNDEVAAWAAVGEPAPGTRRFLDDGPDNPKEHP